MAPRQEVTAEMTWRTVELPTRCANLSCSNEPGEGAFVMLVEHGQPGPRPLTIFVCAPCAAVMRGEQR